MFVKNPVLMFFSSSICNHQGYLRTDISGIDQASLVHLITSLTITLISFMPIFIYFTCTSLYMNKKSLICSNLFRKSPPFHTVIRINLILLSSHILVFFAISFYFFGANVNVSYGIFVGICNIQIVNMPT